ncbi:MAG: glycosyltransferase family 39 protein, partial [Microgenomates group bacterium]
DEAALGYNAYSILKTGRDEYGQLFPIIFKSFGDYKPGLYIYLTVPSVAIFGLNEFAVRFPGALAGIMAVWLIYLIVRLLFTENKQLATISAFIMAVTPWSIHFSRGAWEVNVSLTLTLAGIYFFLKSLQKPKFLILSALSFSLTLLTYHGAKLSTGIVLLILLLLYWKKIIRIKKRILVLSIAAGLLISLPTVLSFFRGQTGRLTVYSLFSYSRPKEYVEIFLDPGEKRIGDFNYYLFHSEALNYTRVVINHWFNHFSGRFLFFEGDWSNPRHSAPYQGMLLLSDLILLICGFVVLVKKGLKRETAFIWLWLILAPLPAILSRDQVHAIRAMNTVIPIIIILSFGLDNILRRSKLIKYGFSLIFFLSFVYYLDAYFVHIPKHNGEDWYYGYEQAVEYITPIQDKYEKIIFLQSYNQPYIFFLFYQKYDPLKYQPKAHLVDEGLDVGLVDKLDNIKFEEFSWPYATGQKGTLVIGDNISIPEYYGEANYTLLKEIRYPDNYKIAFRIVEVK